MATESRFLHWFVCSILTLIVIDSGSSGSRVLVYSWLNPTYVSSVDHFGNDRLPEIVPGVKDESGQWQKKDEPGISSFSPETVGQHLKPLLDFAYGLIPKGRRSGTPVYLLATAGMRLIDPEESNRILESACQYVIGNYEFAVDGGCERHFRVITGELEGIYGY
jgi:Golgi apyrase